MLLSIKKLKRKKILEICFWVIIMGLTFMIWNFPSIKDTAAYYEKNSVIQIIGDRDYSTPLYVMEDEEALEKIKPYKLTLYNSTYRYEKYKLYVGISKEINQDTLKISMDDVSLLKDLYSFSDDECNYYLLDTNELQAGNKVYNFKIWDNKKRLNTTKLIYKFYLEKI